MWLLKTGDPLIEVITVLALLKRILNCRQTKDGHVFHA